MPAYFGEVANACALDRRMQHCSDMLGWKEKFPVRDMGNGKVRAAGIAMSMQGSGISGIDVGSVTVKLNDDGGYMLLIAAADMGTGCDTILAQMVAEHMECPVEAVSVFGADIDASPLRFGFVRILHHLRHRHGRGGNRARAYPGPHALRGVGVVEHRGPRPCGRLCGWRA